MVHKLQKSLQNIALSAESGGGALSLGPKLTWGTKNKTQYLKEQRCQIPHPKQNPNTWDYVDTLWCDTYIGGIPNN